MGKGLRIVAVLLGLMVGGCISSSKRTQADSVQSVDDADVGARVEDVAEGDSRQRDDVEDSRADSGEPTDVGPSDVDAKPDAGACGDGTCGVGENKVNCAKDCYCGNGVCEAGETEITCQADCCGAATCGDCKCDAACGETLGNCPKDCHSCGDGIVSPGEIDCGCTLDACRCPTGGSGCGDGCCMGSICKEDPASCPQDCGTGCGNNICDPGETPVTCSEDCDRQSCGNGLCEGDDGETPESCASDCAAVCGNCICEAGETWLSCPPDCGFCGDNVCSNCAGLYERGNCSDDCRE